MSDSYTKLLLHGDGTNLDTSITESSSGLTVTNPASYDSYTKLCSHFDGADGATAYTDPIASPTGYTFLNQAQLDTAQKKFGTTSLLLDGASDFLTLADGATDTTFGTGDFTIDLWVRFNSVGVVTQAFCGQLEDANNYWNVRLDAGTNLFMTFVDGGNTKGQYFCPWVPVVNTWYHLAFERTTTSAKIFINGVSQALTESVAFGTNDVGDMAGDLRVGCVANSDDWVNGWLDELRISKGIARWTADFTAPVAPYGQVVISTVQKKFGTGSLLFDGSGSYLSLADSADWDLGNTFTIDLWVRFNNIIQSQTFFHQSEPTYNNLYDIGWRSANILYFESYISGLPTIAFSAPFVPVVNTWYHIALVRIDDGNVATSWRIFIDGVSQTLTKVSGDWNGAMPTITGNAQIGGINNTTVYLMDGYIDELRISKGVARWTSDFMLPLRAYDTLTPFNPICIGG